jgi:hypothetical protein
MRNEEEKSDYPDGVFLDSADLTSPLNRTPTAASQTTSAATIPTRAASSPQSTLVETRDPAASAAAVPVAAAPRQATPEYRAPNVERADKDVEVYDIGDAGRFSNIVEE